MSRVKKSGLDACDFDVILNAEHENHDHDMKYLYGSQQAHIHGAARSPEPRHDTSEYHHEDQAHDHRNCDHSSNNQEHNHHTHGHRNLSDIMDILEQAQLTDRARATAKKIFTILGEAEAKAHGTTLEEVHFHEVGAVDSIVDIVSAAVCLDSLDVQEIIVPVRYERCRTPRCQHGVLPVPGPAVSNIAAAQHLKLHITGLPGEFVTPTGAAIVAAVRTSDTLPEEFTIERIGLGAGKRSYEGASGLLRAMLIS
ncbi:MAG: LarC family nickel insertion protein [Lachnospiraceae bacterium]|nr:LarC family nickel insertion protein [Lachnospiraceae bacterium]